MVLSVYFDSIAAATVHGGELNSLRAYYKRR